MPRQLYPLERDPMPILQEAVWAPEPIWTGGESLAGIRLPGLPARSESVVPTELSERRETLGSNSVEVWRSAQFGQFETGNTQPHSLEIMKL